MLHKTGCLLPGNSAASTVAIRHCQCNVIIAPSNVITTSSHHHRTITTMAAAKTNTGSGYLGDLSAEQEKALAAFRASSRGADGKSLDKTNDDAQLLRFLRARKFVVKEAEEMRAKHLEWRVKWDIENILKTRPPKMDLYEKMLPVGHHGVDLEGRPVVYEKLGKAKGEVMLKLFTVEEFLRWHNYKMQTLLQRVDAQAKATGKPVESFTMVLDAAGVSFSGNNGFLKDCGDNDSANYPERLGRLLVVNAPWVFPFFWKIVSPFIDAKTKAKIEVIYGNPNKDILKTIAIDGLVHEYGGKCECKGKGKDCVPEFDISDLKLSDITGSASDNNTTVVAAGKKHEQTYTCKPKGGTLHWYFRVADDYNVSFSVEVTTTRVLAGGKKEEKKEVIRKPTKLVTDQGSHTVDDASAVWTICFDNSYSWRTAKSVAWSAMALNKEDAPAVVGTADPMPSTATAAAGTGKDEAPVPGASAAAAKK